jgi:hypothetical protein
MKPYTFRAVKRCEHPPFLAPQARAQPTAERARIQVTHEEAHKVSQGNRSGSRREAGRPFV